ncbi:MAG: hypothetical protein AAF675_19680 [Pseudomonadota bacterium]
MAGILVSIALASYIALQAASAGANQRIVLPVAGGLAAVMAAFWSLAVETLFPKPDFWSHVLQQMATSFVAAGVGALLFVFAARRLMDKIAAFKKKYPER